MNVEQSAARALTNQPLIAWDDLIGNKGVARAAIKIVRNEIPSQRMFVAGPSGSGKSTTINHVCASAACHRPVATEPCRKCRGCQNFVATYRDTGLLSFISDPDRLTPFHYLPINCRRINASELKDRLEDIRFQDGVRIIHLEEVVHLKRLECDMFLTDVMDDPAYRSVIWFASAVTDHGLDGQFRRRWPLKKPTSPPSSKKLACYLAKKCAEHGIKIDHPATWEILAKRSWRVVGLALNVLENAAASDPPMLTKKAVESYPLPTRDPWRDEFFER